jgi:ubiquinone/menaquinone biosynthesis C-methylase UbiE
MRALTTALVFTSFSLTGLAQQFSPLENLGPAIPTPQSIVERMLEAGHVKPGEMVYDLGSGDGRIVITAAQKFGARAVGVELMPDIARKARERVRLLGLADRVSIVEGNALRVDVSPADVVTMWFLTNSNERLRPNLEKHLRVGARVVSNEFPVHGWRPTEVVHVKTGKMEHTIYVYEIGRTK